MEALAISSMAVLKDASLVFEGLWKPEILRTNWREAARTSSGVTCGSKLKRILMFRHMGAPTGELNWKMILARICE